MLSVLVLKVEEPPYTEPLLTLLLAIASLLLKGMAYPLFLRE
jgi:hypothetical protein